MQDERIETESVLAIPLRKATPSVAFPSLRQAGFEHPSHGARGGAAPALLPRGEVAGRRRRLARVVVAIVAACAAILLTAGIRLAVPRETPPPVAFVAPPVLAPTLPAPSPGETAAANPTAGAAPTGDPALTADLQTTGTVRLERSALVGHVWLDGEKLKTASPVVACGKHEIRVGVHGHGHVIDVPCGGEVAVSR
jgi:hypothetical protein